jgi:hypothetical protein
MHRVFGTLGEKVIALELCFSMPRLDMIMQSFGAQKIHINCRQLSSKEGQGPVGLVECCVAMARVVQQTYQAT